ncbi:replication-relaxation family protein [Streptomyces sp. NPDC005303]|uniref:replication-relaxation family protein n=1 Tax=Streptomyces sp. NPDC005303 TaxID=3155713 RepID=UPI0033B27D8F
MPGEASRAREAEAAKAGAEIRGEVLLTLAQVRLATPRQLKALLLPHQQDTDHVRRALRNLLAESPALVGRTNRAQQSYWYCTPAGLAEAAASGELAPGDSRATGKRIAASKTGLREHGLALVDTVVAFHQAELADHADWQVEVAHPTPAGNLVPDGVVLLDNGSSAFGDRPHDVLPPPGRQAGTLRRLPQRACVRARERRPVPAPPLAGDLRRTVSGAVLPAARTGSDPGSFDTPPFRPTPAIGLTAWPEATAHFGLGQRAVSGTCPAPDSGVRRRRAGRAPRVSVRFTTCGSASVAGWC